MTQPILLEKLLEIVRNSESVTVIIDDNTIFSVGRRFAYLEINDEEANQLRFLFSPKFFEKLELSPQE